MCGISGLVNCGDRETLVRMTNVQTHRGADDSGLWERHFPDADTSGWAAAASPFSTSPPMATCP